MKDCFDSADDELYPEDYYFSTIFMVQPAISNSFIQMFRKQTSNVQY